MKQKDKIEVIMTPDDEIKNTSKPYLWCVLAYKGETWYNKCFGWSETPEQAWKDALEYYEAHK